MTADDRDDFAAMLAEYGDSPSLKLHVGDKVQAKAIHVGDECVFFELSPSQEGFVSKEGLLDDEGRLAVKLGETIEAFVVGLQGGIELSRTIGRNQIDIEMLEAASDSQAPVQGLVTGTNKGGLEVSIGNARGFCPIGQADIEYVEDPQSFVGKTFEFAVRAVKEGGRNILLSRRALLEIERSARAEKLMQSLEVGQQAVGTVTRLATFGAFVDLGGIDGLIPIGELSNARVERVEEVLKKGDEVTVAVLRIEDDPKRPGKKRIGLSLKAALPDPFDVHASALGEGKTAVGTVGGLESYGAFVDLFDGEIRGLVHISELANRRTGHPREVVSVGDTVTVKILGVDRDNRRVSLSLKAAQQDPVGDAGDTSGEPGVGDDVIGTVERIERYGVFVRLSGGSSALLPAAETGADQGADLQRAFPMGTEIGLRVIAIDDRGRVKVSKTARDQAEERVALSEYGGKDRDAGFGTLGQLLKKKGF